MTPTTLHSCGIAAAVLYVWMTLFVGLFWDGYDLSSQTISELSAIGAPTRPLWMLLGAVYTILMLVFGWSVWRSAASNRLQRALGMVLLVHAVLGSYWPPMHQRDVLAANGRSLTETLHITWAALTGIFFMLEAGLGAAAFGKRFRAYSIVTIVIVLVSGAITGTFTARMEANLPTPGLGLWERVGSTAYMLWIATLAATLRSRF